MTHVRRPTRTHEGLSDWLGEDVVEYVKRRKGEGWTHEKIAQDLAESGYIVKPTTITNWLSGRKRKGVK